MPSPSISATCSVADCAKPMWAKGYCSTHYQRVRKYGDPNALPRFDPVTRKKRRDDFFNANVDRSGGPDACWPWMRSPQPNGYGQLAGYTGHTSAHRFAYELAHGPIPDRLTVEHSCHTEKPTCPGGNTCPHRLCCNPSHMDLVPFGINVEIAEQRQREISGKPQRVVSNRPCAHDGCDGLVHARDYCCKHYRRFTRHGDSSISLR